MTKLEFLFDLRERMKGLPREDIEERLRFYSEMIEDRMEEGLTEEEAVASVGTVDEIAEQISADTPVAQPAKKLKAWEIVLIAVGFPLWLSLLVAVVAVAVSLYVSLWAVIISLWAVFGALVGCAFGGAAAGIVFALSGHGLVGVATIGTGLVCAGLSVFMFYGSKIATKGVVLLTKLCLGRRRKAK